MFPGLIVSWHHRLVEKYLLMAFEGKVRKLLIREPPRHTKSLMVSRAFPAWWFGHRPADEIIQVAYGDELARDHGRAVRNWVGSPRYKGIFPDVALSSDSKSANRFNTNKGGVYVSVGIGGPVTGRGANCFPAGTMVSTDHGDIDIKDLHLCSTSVKVSSHDGHKVTHQKIQAVSLRDSTRLFRVTTSAGRMVDATPEHPFFTRRGWVRADKLAPGDGLLCTVRQGHDSTGLRDSQASATRAHQNLLLHALLVPGPESEKAEHQAVRGLREGEDLEAEVWEQGERLLLQGLLAGLSGAQERDYSESRALAQVLGVREEVPDLPSRSVLQPAMQGRRSLQAHVWNRQPRLQARTLTTSGAGPRIPGLSSSEVSDSYQGRRQVRYLRGGRTSSHPPYQPGPTGQPLGKSNLALPYLPLIAPWRRAVDESAEKDTVRSVSEIPVGPCPIKVYDLQVEDTHCFFANGILVHNCLSIDDPYKDRMEADSKATLKAVKDFYEAVAYTRMQPGAVQILTTTNWGDACIDQYLIREGKKNNDPWTVLDLPALIEPDFPKQHPDDPRAEGEALWPGRYSVDDLKKIRVNVGPRNWAALYQQKPIPDGGSIISPTWLKRYDRLPPLKEFGKIYFSCDLTFKETDDGSFVVFQVWATKGAQFWLLDQVRKRMGYAESKKEFAKLMKVWPMALLKLVEDKANGSALQSDLEGTVPGIVMVEPEGDKVNRLEGVSPYFAAGNVYIPASGLCALDDSGQRWIDTWTEELTRFPISEFDDQVDATSQALAYGHLTGLDTFEAQSS